MPSEPLSFQPIRNSLYAPSELFTGFDLDNPDSFASTFDFTCYRYFVEHGRNAPSDRFTSMMEALHDDSIGQSTLAVSLAIPTWYYGHEPSTPFATHIAKYFQNNIREDGLLTVAAHGIVYAPGRAGTLQEIFQDSAQNYYHSVGDRFSPMVFLDSTYWRTTLPVEALLSTLFAGKPDEYKKYVVFVDKVNDVVAFIKENSPPEGQHLMRLRMGRRHQ